MLEASLGEPQHHRSLTVFPILAEVSRELSYILLADALATGVLTIGEKNGGQVPFLLTRNSGPDPVLILDGEQLIGARQNRMTNRSILLAPESTTEIPVSCMEQGRWHFVGDHFAPAPQNAPSKVRRRAREMEARASYAAEARSPGARSSYRDLAGAQGEVWEEIRLMGDMLGGASPTGALDSLYHHRRRDTTQWLEAYPLLPHQMGLLAFTGDVPLGMDVVGDPVLFTGLHQRILTGYVREAERTPSDSVGMGEYRILRGNALGGELVHEDRLVHLSAFPAREERDSGRGPRPAGQGGPGPPRGVPIARPSQRRRRS
jgi:hypothetical protein